MKAYLHYVGEIVPIQTYSLAFYKTIKWNGRPGSRVLGGFVTVTIEASGTTVRFIEELLHINTQLRDPEQDDPSLSDCFKEVHIKITQDDQHPVKEIQLLDAHIKNIREIFSAYEAIGASSGINNMVTIEFASASQVINNGAAKNIQPWWITKFKPKQHQAVVKEFAGEQQQQFRKYQVDRRGYISLYAGKKEHVGAYDILMNYKGEEIKVRDTSILSNIERGDFYSKFMGKNVEVQVLKVTGLSKNEIKQLFEFIAKASNNEITYSNWTKNKYISTSFAKTSDMSTSYLLSKTKNILLLVHHVHSHPKPYKDLDPSPADLLSKDVIRKAKSKLKIYKLKMEIYSPYSNQYREYTHKNASIELDEIILKPNKNE
ncbi:MAG: hypothetical protein OIF50_13370 [Flavobacteriaceae bacterium]|nr:hypothetical protein [Flavobacteriaceae bacterium]